MRISACRCCPISETHPRLGLAIATRTCGTAVARNRIKRLTRESFRMNQHTLPTVDVTVAVRDGARLAAAGELRDSLAKHWRSIAQARTTQAGPKPCAAS